MSVHRCGSSLFLVTGFAALSALVGAAPGFGWLIAAWVGQGIFGAALFALLPVIAVVAVRPEARGRAMGLIATLGPLGAVTGPAAGGLMVEQLGWRWIFYIIGPVSLLVILIVLRTMTADGPLRWPAQSPRWR